LLQPGRRAAHHRELQTSITAACRTGAWTAHRRRLPGAGDHVHHHLQHQHLAGAPPATAARCWPRPPPPAAPAPGHRAANGRRELLATSTTTYSAGTWPVRRPAPERDRGI